MHLEVKMPKGSAELTAARRDEIMDACESLYRTMNFKEITLKDTVIPKITDNADTGDTAIVAFTALLVLSGAALVLMAKKRKLF